MTEMTSFALADGMRVTVATPAAPGLTQAGLRSKAVQAEQTLREALRPVTSAAAEVVREFRELPGRPTQVEIQFGVRLDATAGAVIATAGVGTHLDITLRWGAAEPSPAASPAADAG